MSQLVPARRRRAEPSVTRWEPMGDIEQVAQRMQRMLDQTMGGLAWPLIGGESRPWTPMVDIEEQDDAYVVECELPGVSRDDVNIEVMGNELTITGEVKEHDRQGMLRERTRRTGRFEYDVTLPEPVDAERVEAMLKDGVLTVRVPKSERAQRKKIEVKNG
jgi:HSP20 family protein